MKNLTRNLFRTFNAILIFTIVYLPHSFAQQVNWTQTYGGSSFDGAYDTKSTTDGGYIVAGFSGSVAPAGGSSDVYLLKTDQAGNVLWYNTFGGPFDDIGREVIQTSDGGYAVAGYFGLGGQEHDQYLIRTDADGNLLWEETYDFIDDDRAHSLTQTSDGGFILAGQAWVPNGINSSYDFFVVKTNDLGVAQWSKTYSFTNYGNDVALTIKELSDSGYIIGGFTQAGPWAAYLIRTDAAGNTLWSQTYIISSQSECYSLEVLPDGGFIFTGSATIPGQTNSEVYLVRTDSNGNLQWQKTFGGTTLNEGDDWGRSICLLPDGGFAIAGMTSSFGAGSWDVYVIRTNGQGDSLWTRTFGGVSDDRGHGIDFSQDNKIIVAGWAYSFGAGGGDFYLVNLNESIVPVELISFSSAVNSNTVNLNWITATEINNYGFDVERSVEPGKWIKIGFVEGNGNSSSTKRYSYTDDNPVGGNTFKYRLKQIDTDGSYEYSSVVEVELVLSEFTLYQNYPNPFNPNTTIKYSVPSKSKVQIKVFDGLGNEIGTLVNEEKEVGSYEINFTASSLPSGVYFYRIKAGNYVNTKKMILMK